MPSPNLMASIVARLTSRIKVAVVGNALPLYDPPTRVAEEFAIIDCISGGRSSPDGRRRRARVLLVSVNRPTPGSGSRRPTT